MFSHIPQTSHNKEKQAVPQVPNKARARCVTGYHGCFPFSQSSLWTNRGESRVVGSLCKRLALHHWWAYGSRGCADCVLWWEHSFPVPVSLVEGELSHHVSILCLHNNHYGSKQDTSANCRTSNYQEQKQKWLLAPVKDTSVRNLDHQAEAMKHVPNPKFSLLTFRVLFSA